MHFNLCSFYCCCCSNSTYCVNTTLHSWGFCLLFQVYWLGPMCGGIAAALIYDFLLFPRSQNFSRRRQVLLNGPESENDAVETTREGSGSPGPSQWPKWAFVWLLFVIYEFNVILIEMFIWVFLFVFLIYDRRHEFFIMIFFFACIYYFEICHN